ATKEKISANQPTVRGKLRAAKTIVSSSGAPEGGCHSTHDSRPKSLKCRATSAPVSSELARLPSRSPARSLSPRIGITSAGRLHTRSNASGSTGNMGAGARALVQIRQDDTGVEYNTSNTCG